MNVLRLIYSVHECVPSWMWIAFGWVMHVTAFLMVCSHCLRTRREASSALLWIFISLSFPIVGPVLYLSFGIYRVPEKGFKKRIADEKLMTERMAREDEQLSLAYWRSLREAVRGEPDSDFDKEVNRAMNSIIPDHPMLGGNEIKPLVNGDETFPLMLAAIREAKHHVHLQSFIIADDSVGGEFLDLLAEKAKAGVVVRVLFDRFGSTRAFLNGFFRKYGSVPNMNVAGWTQANVFKRQFQINLRNHRKLLIVDGKHAFTGGINLHEENVTRGDAMPIRDYHFEIKGPLVHELQYTFMRDWYFITDEDPENLLNAEYYPRIAPSGSSMIRLVNSGPTVESPPIADLFFMAMVAAHKQVIIVTPYFVPTSDIVRAMRVAALRGVDVQLIVPKENNHVYAGLAGCALYDELLEAGVRIFERRPPFMHAKALIADDTLAVVGTANLDVRSLRLNYETNLVVSDDRFVETLKEIVLEDVAMSDPLELLSWRSRPAYRRLAENFCNLLTPIL